MTTNPKSAAELRADIANLQSQINSMARFPLEPLRQRLTRVTTQALLDINLKGEVVIAQRALEHEEQNHIRFAELQGAIVVLERDLQEAETRERIAACREADATHARLAAEYDAACRVVCRLFEQLIDQQAILSRTTPGWRAPALPTFNFSQMVPPGWSGETSEHVRTSSLSWLNAEKAKAA